MKASFPDNLKVRFSFFYFDAATNIISFDP